MGQVLLRKMPDDLVRLVKSKAALRGIPMRDYVIEALEEKLQMEDGSPKRKRGRASRKN